MFGLSIGGIFWVATAVLGIVLGAAYMLWLYQRTMWGPITKSENESLKDLNAREIATLVPLIVLAIWIGLYPKPFFKILEQPVAKLVSQMNGEWQGDHVARANADAGGVLEESR